MKTSCLSRTIWSPSYFCGVIALWLACTPTVWAVDGSALELRADAITKACRDANVVLVGKIRRYHRSLLPTGGPHGNRQIIEYRVERFIKGESGVWDMPITFIPEFVTASVHGSSGGCSLDPGEFKPGRRHVLALQRVTSVPAPQPFDTPDSLKRNGIVAIGTMRFQFYDVGVWRATRLNIRALRRASRQSRRLGDTQE